YQIRRPVRGSIVRTARRADRYAVGWSRTALRNRNDGRIAHAEANFWLSIATTIPIDRENSATLLYSARTIIAEDEPTDSGDVPTLHRWRMDRWRRRRDVRKYESRDGREPRGVPSGDRHRCRPRACGRRRRLRGVGRTLLHRSGG